MFSILNRYIFKEVLYPFLMTLFVFTFVLIMGRILSLVDLMINKGVQFTDILKLIVFLMPALLLFTIPLALIIAILIAIGRLSRDNEFTVMQACGLSFHKIAGPVLAAALIAFLMTAVTTFFLIPKGNMAAKNLLYWIVKQKASVGIKEKVFSDDFQGIVLYADRIPVNGDFMEGVLLYEQRTTEEPNMIIASKGYLISNPESFIVTLRLENGSIHTVDPGFKNYKKVDFSTYDVRLDFKGSAADQERVKFSKLDEMTLWELQEQMNKTDTEGPTPRELMIEFNQRLASPFTCLIFAMLGIPLGVQSSRSGKMRGFTIGLGLVMVYYVFLLYGKALGETGVIPPALGVWTPNVVFMAAGLYIYFMRAREREIAPKWLRLDQWKR
ncbi:MAG TPA: LPS export ABC transporter permease LptF [Syntrophales bacterium]|nr:LPS export ABC transporter permease LptF [Syntrophales bacterium]